MESRHAGSSATLGSSSDHPGISAVGLARSFGAISAVRDCSLDVALGRVHALVGLNGAGKTTLMRLLLGMLRPDRGRVSILGVALDTADSRLWRRVGHMIETPFGYPELTVRENLFCSGLLHAIPRDRLKQAASHRIDQFALGAWADRPARTLSAGNRQRLGLACAILHNPTVLVLDEPSNALDPSGIILVREVLREAAQAGAAILVSSHHLDEIARVADQISVLHDGQIIGELDPAGTELEHTFFLQIVAHDKTSRAGEQ